VARGAVPQTVGFCYANSDPALQSCAETPGDLRCRARSGVEVLTVVLVFSPAPAGFSERARNERVRWRHRSLLRSAGWLRHYRSLVTVPSTAIRRTLTRDGPPIPQPGDWRLRRLRLVCRRGVHRPQRAAGPSPDSTSATASCASASRSRGSQRDLSKPRLSGAW
jgi:hypothetical protein